ncbi:sigma-70 family RNA polymerase sigma factor [uncultured Clostridium sp.]|uniref:RNA polymerase sigma factor n=1 Tax=uncultured Clostridium sp. TaxID=59620 RepID=UPI00261B5BB6|nr:sigma-70 family RNA polymerase sigma factor [uncultured Clostridium sp.]
MKLLHFSKKGLVYKAKDGDIEAFMELIRENKLLMYKVALNMIKRECDIDDAIQETIINAFENIKNLREEKNFKSWLITILINECKRILKKNKKLVLVHEFNNEAFEERYENVDIIEAINELDNESKEIVILYYFEDLKQEEISKKLNLNSSTVRTKLSRAKKKLYKILGEDYVYEQ